MAQRSILACAVACLVFPVVALAQPFPGTSVVPPYIRLLTPRAGPQLPAAVYTVVVNDFFGFPLAGQTVTLDFTGCTQVGLASEQSYPGMAVASCAPPVLSAVTNGAGEARFYVNGSVLHRVPAGNGVGCITVSAGFPPVVLGTTTPSAYDEDGVNGLTANDLSLWLCDFGSGSYYGRSDYTGDGAITVQDLISWIDQFTRAAGTSRTGERCDGAPASIPENPVASPTLRLAWNACANDGGAATRVFACGTNAGFETLEASFVAPPGVGDMTGFEAEVEVFGTPGAALPAWWQFESGGCRSASLSVDLGYPDLGSSCIRGELDTGNWTGIVSTYYPEPAPAPNRMLVRIVGAVAAPGTPNTPGRE
jgi:hypothetical protein